ncbi:hypothetical protein [Sphingobacterium sp. LRF_L2]|uniref:hypothetical protein n=1 Tax=Sphingobacterium sp. LRF_L2 TaxID=3369421 RepID=UPI003F5D61B4
MSLARRLAITLAGLVGFVLLALVLIPLFFKEEINKTVKELINKNIQGQVDYSTINLSFFRHFPSLTAALEDVHVKGSAPFQDSTLLQAKAISVGIDLLSLLQSKVVLDKFIISDGHIHVMVDSTGAANYNIYASETDGSTKSEDSSSDSQMKFRLIKLENIDLLYQDASIPLEISAQDFDYEGRGDLSTGLFDLQTNAQIASFSFNFDGEQYIDKKSIAANLLTQVNTNDLSFIFQRNDIKINKLPVQFKGAFAFLSNGYHLDFKLKSQESTLSELLSLVPANYAEWLKDTKVQGTSEVFMNLVGDYIVEQNEMPDLSLGIIINNGYLAYQDAKVPLSDWNAKLRVDLPQLNLDSLNVDLKQFDFKVADGFFKGAGQIRGMDPLTIHSTVSSHIDLGSLYKAVQWPSFSFAGTLELEGKIDGTYATDTLTYGIRNKKKVYVSSIPTFSINNTLRNGYLKLSDLPAAIDNISYTLAAEGKDGQLKTAQIALTELDIRALNNFIKGHAIVKDFEHLDVDANVNARIDLSDIKKIYPVDSIEIAGNILVDIVSKGRMNLKQHRIPATQATIHMQDGYFKSLSHPIPVEQIAVETNISSPKGTLKDLHIKILPISFRLAGEPFSLHADLANFDNVKYAITSKGKLNLGPLYQLFATDGLSVNGYVQTDLNLAGLQSDAIRGNYNRLRNRGYIDIGNINVETELFPLPIEIKSGHFSFEQEKLKFDRFLAKYGKNQLQVQGFIDNIVNYLTLDSDVLRGEFNLKSPSLRIDDFMAFSSGTGSPSSTNNSSGVVLLPTNLDIQVKGVVDHVYYDQEKLQNFRGNLKLTKGTLQITDTGFELAGLKTNMNIAYQPLHLRKAKFDFEVKADSFDIQRAYKEIPLFQQMVSSAKNAQGIVSLNYQLGGLLNDQMSPIMPSIQGKGVLTLEQIKFYNFKLLNSISSATSKDSFLDSDVKKVNIKTSIKNNVMTIERTKMKMAGFRPRFEGQVTLDGQMNLGFRLGLPPFGIFGIPMRITGTSEHYKIKLGKYKEEDLDTDMDEDDKAAYEATLVPDSTTVEKNE